MVRLFAAFLVLLAFAPRASAACAFTYQQARLIAEAVAENEPAVRYEEFDGERAQKLIAVINATPPAGDIALDRILTNAHTDTGRVKIAYVKGECVFYSGEVAIAEFEALKARAFGDAAKP